MAAGDVTTKYGTPTAIIITLASLPESDTMVVGRESTAVTVADPVLDHAIRGKITTGPTPTAGKVIRVYVVVRHDDTPTWPGPFDGTDSSETLDSENSRDSMCFLAHTIVVDSTSDRTYWIKPFSLRNVLGFLPNTYVLFVTHETDANLNATAGNHEFKYVPIYENVAAS
jgi:hypothetical protein